MTLSEACVRLADRLPEGERGLLEQVVELADAYASLDSFLVASRHPWTSDEMERLQVRVSAAREALGLSYEAVAA